MSASASLKNSRSPQVIIEKLARKRITDEEAEKILEQKWGRAYDTPTVIRFFREMFRPRIVNKRVPR
jgi:transposase